MNMSDDLVQGTGLPSRESSSIRSLLKLEEGLSMPPANDGCEIEHYLYERYASDPQCWKRNAYYFLKPLIPRSVQLALRKEYAVVQAKESFPSWPIEPIVVDIVHRCLRNTISQSEAGAVHRIAPWPEETSFAFAITHDVDCATGLRQAHALAEIENALGFVSSWNIVPERHPIDWKIVEKLQSRGCELGVHGLTHDGNLFQSRKIFEHRVAKINQYAKE